MMKVCQIEIDGKWSEVGIDDARTLHNSKRMRCQYCDGEVHAYPRQGSQASIPHFGHNVANPGCPTVKHPYPLK
jgi:hypothetical protein